MVTTTLQRFHVTYRGYTFTISARSHQAIAEALATIHSYAETLVPIV